MFGHIAMFSHLCFYGNLAEKPSPICVNGLVLFGLLLMQHASGTGLKSFSELNTLLTHLPLSIQSQKFTLLFGVS